MNKKELIALATSEPYNLVVDESMTNKVIEDMIDAKKKELEGTKPDPNSDITKDNLGFPNPEPIEPDKPISVEPKEKEYEIYSPNKEFTGVSASVGFANGVGRTKDAYLVEWFKEKGYEVKEV